jgi:hypothetical protein
MICGNLMEIIGRGCLAARRHMMMEYMVYKENQIKLTFHHADMIIAKWLGQI